MLIFRYTFVYLTLAVDREHVPDILSAHGMCSHHEWTSYRNALGYRAADGSPLWLGSSDDDGALDTPRVRAWNSTSVSWPNIFMNFDGSQALQSDRTTMSSANFLGMRADICDSAYLHSGFSSTGERLQLCSGYMVSADYF